MPWVTHVSRIGPPALIAILATIGVALAIPVVGAAAGAAAEPRISLPVLAALWTAFELVALYLQFGKEVDNADELILTEIPLVLGLLFATPTDVLLVGVGVPVLVDLVRRRRSALKQIFNGANRGVEITLALTIYQALSPAQPLALEAGSCSASP